MPIIYGRSRAVQEREPDLLSQIVTAYIIFKEKASEKSLRKFDLFQRFS